MSCLLLYSCILVLPSQSLHSASNLLASSSSISIAPVTSSSSVSSTLGINPVPFVWTAIECLCWVFPPFVSLFTTRNAVEYRIIPYPDGIPLHARIFKPIQGTTRLQELHHLITHCYALVLQYRCIRDQNWFGRLGYDKSMELEKTSKQELSSLSSIRSITPPNEQGEKNPSEICRIKLINVVHSTILAIKKQDMDSFFFFF